MATKTPTAHFSFHCLQHIKNKTKKNAKKRKTNKSSWISDCKTAQTAPVIFGQTKFTKQHVSHHIYLGMILKNLRLWVILDYAKRTLCINTYQFHFFVLPMIFMPNPTAPYLCSQLASVTKGLCKLLLQANRFLPTSEETASYAAPICPPGMHKNMSPIFFSFFFFLLVLTVLFRGRWRG